MKKYGWIALLVLAADRITKLLAVRLTAPVTLIPSVVGLRYARNTGMAFSLLSGFPWLLGILSLAVITAAFVFLRGYPFRGFTLTALMFMLGGALGNALDRFFTGFVVDMVEILAFPFPIFNVADSFLTVGCAMLILSLIRHPEEWKKPSDGKNPEEGEERNGSH